VLDEQAGILWTGDLLFVQHLPVVDGSLKGWLALLDRLAAVPVHHAVPGHGPPLVAWPTALTAQRAYLTTLADDLRRLIAAGIGMRQAAERAGKAARGSWRLFDAFNARNATAGYAELEWE
jgi:glyoxylase-like metal-dependent hydrolase (beta-lactamase superfamily II)